VARVEEQVIVDGALGEGGGQVLRTALTMSLAAGRPFRIENIRANRPKPGLLRQHLAAVKAAAAIGTARVTGDVAADGVGPGNVLFVAIESEHVTEVFTGFGELGVTAEAVASRAVHEARRYLAGNVPVGICLADQLLPVLALGAGGSFRTLSLSRHGRTNADVIRLFRDVAITVTEHARDNVEVRVDVP
jgi:RNA 3'-terminal phosphate cyclase (ATP)